MSGPTFLQHLLRLGAVASLYSRAGASLCREIPGDPPAETVELHRRRADGGAGEIAVAAAGQYRLERLRRPTVGARAGANVRFGSLATLERGP